MRCVRRHGISRGRSVRHREDCQSGTLSFLNRRNFRCYFIPDLSEPGLDYTIGLIASKDLVFVNLDLKLLYTMSGNCWRKDTVEVSLATGWRLKRRVDLIPEMANVTCLGLLRRGTRNEMEATVGLGWKFNKFLKFQRGVVFMEHGVWEAVFAWEWSFGGN